jgi:hypothetical protein
MHNTRIGQNHFSSRKPGVDSGSQVIAVVQAAQSLLGSGISFFGTDSLELYRS